jgi:flagellar biosynthesis component FlhA
LVWLWWWVLAFLAWPLCLAWKPWWEEAEEEEEEEETAAEEVEEVEEEEESEDLGPLDREDLMSLSCAGRLLMPNVIASRALS